MYQRFAEKEEQIWQMCYLSLLCSLETLGILFQVDLRDKGKKPRSPLLKQPSCRNSTGNMHPWHQNHTQFAEHKEISSLHFASKIILLQLF